MTLKDSTELLGVFDTALMEIKGSSPLSSSDRRRIADDLAEVYNYVSASIQKPSFTNAIYARSAHDAKQEIQLDQEREALREHQQFVENNFDKAEQYLRAIQLGGYAAFFALWGFTREWIDPVWTSLAAILMMISASSFVIWELYKATTLSFALKRHASISEGKLEKFIKSRMSKLIQEKSVIVSLAKSRATVWIVSISSAVLAICIMLIQLLGVISNGLFG